LLKYHLCHHSGSHHVLSVHENFLIFQKPGELAG
jgi:hypothetical protein